MKISTFAKVLFLSILFATTSFPQVSVPGFDADYISVNSIKMWINNYGKGSHDPFTDDAGLYYPNSSNQDKTLVYTDGLFWIGKINNKLYCSGTNMYTGVIPGTVESGTPTESTKNKFRVYKVNPDWDMLPPGTKRDKLQTDFNEWPSDIGAPYFDINKNETFEPGIDAPQIWGDEMLWYICHDNDPIMDGLYKNDIEVQVLVYAFDRKNLLQDVVFKKYRIINKGQYSVDSMFVSYFSNPIVGDAYDNFVGCDSSLFLAYCYNADSIDAVYGTPPPAVGYALLQGPKIKSDGDSAFYDNRFIPGYKNLEQTSFAFNQSKYINHAYQFPYLNAINYWNYLCGLDSSGFPYINPNSGKPTKFPLSGDPYRQTGWYEGEGWPGGLNPGERRMMLNTGPFTMAPGDTQEVVYAILVGQGSSNTRSVEELKLMVPKLQYFHKNYLPPMPEMKEEKKQLDFKLTQNYPNPFNSSTIVHYQIPLDSRVTVKVFDVLGNEVAVLKDEYQNAGDYDAVFNAENLASGLYILNISAREFFSSKKMILLR